MLHSQIVCQTHRFSQSRRFGIFTHLRESRICEIDFVLKKISAENQSKKITLFFDVAKRPPFPQPPGECKSCLCFKLPWKIYRFNVISVSLAIFPFWKNYQVSTYSVFINCIAAGHRSQLFCLNVLSVSLAIFPICVFIICIAAGHLSHLYHGLNVYVLP